MFFHPNENHEQLVLEDERVVLMAKRTLLEKALIALSCIAVLCCLVLVGVITASHYKVSQTTDIIKDAQRTKPSDPCVTKACVLSAAEMLASMNESVDPCENFYLFACGQWIASHTIPEENSGLNQFSMATDVIETGLRSILKEPISDTDPKPVNQAKTLFRGCINEKQLETRGLKPLLDLLEEFDGWPISLPRWNVGQLHWQDFVARAKRLFNLRLIVKIYVSGDMKNRKENALYIDQPSLSMPRSVLVNSGEYGERIGAWKEYMRRAARLISTSMGHVPDEETLEKDVNDVLNFEIEIANATTKSEDRRIVDSLYNAMTIKELQNFTGGGIFWQELLNNVFSSVNITVSENTKVIVVDKSYFKRLSSIVIRTRFRIISNYLLWRIIMILGIETTSQMRKFHLDYRKVSYGVTAEETRIKHCISKTNNYLGMAIGTKYIKNSFSDDTKSVTNEMVENIRKAFEDLLKNNDWMEESIKPLAIEKIKHISKLIAYPDWYNNKTKLEEKYKRLSGITLENHFQNVINLRHYDSVEELIQLENPRDRLKWYSSPTYANAFYWPSYNSIIFLAGILQPPFFRPGTLHAINYGAIGQIIGHEISHGFDDEGRQYDKFGNAKLWWSNRAIETFKSKAQCVIDQYSSYRVPEIDKLKSNATINGITTQGENIADMAGIRQAFLAYKNYVRVNGEEKRLPGLLKYTPEQLFFIANANIWCSKYTVEGLLDRVLTDPHSPSPYRAMGSVSNSEEFAKTWNCPLGSPMNPKKKCVVW